MGFKREFRAVPVKVSRQSRAADRKRQHSASWHSFIPVVVGLSALTFGGVFFYDDLKAGTFKLGSTLDLTRRRAPQAGDYWSGCDDARGAGTAPIYRLEPGYRPEMDGDDDGIACEPYYGR
jgi:hypothetical protein